MNKVFLAIALTLSLAACSSHSQSDRTVGGALIGAGTGALVGGAIDGGRGAAVGALIGGAGGAVIGHQTAPKSCVYRDERGRRYRDVCP